jgi:hypothetical protein
MFDVTIVKNTQTEQTMTIPDVSTYGDHENAAATTFTRRRPNMDATWASGRKSDR